MSKVHDLPTVAVLGAGDMVTMWAWEGVLPDLAQRYI